VLITAYCPSCRTAWRLKPELVGQKMRCPNPACREIFVVQDGGSPAPASGASAPESDDDLSVPLDVKTRVVVDGPNRDEGNQYSGSVGDILPILPAEPVGEPPPAPAGTCRAGRAAHSVRWRGRGAADPSRRSSRPAPTAAGAQATGPRIADHTDVRAGHGADAPRGARRSRGAAAGRLLAAGAPGPQPVRARGAPAGATAPRAARATACDASASQGQN